MNEIIIPYNTISPQRQKFRDRIQLLGASICIVIGYSETLSFYTGIYFILPLIGFAIAVLNIIFIKYYKILVKKYGDKFEIFLIRTNGIIMLTTGIGYQITGSKYVQYAYYLLTILFFFILPWFILPAKKKRLTLQFTGSGIIVKKRIKTVIHKWQNIELFCIKKNVLKIKKSGKVKIFKYFLEQKNNKQEQILSFVKTIKSEYGHEIDIQNICEDK